MDSRKIAQEIYNIDHNDALYAPVKEALDVIDECLDIHGQNRISLSFNGGKDCTVLLHLYAGAIARRLKDGEPMPKIHSLYIPVPSPFDSLEEFIESCVKLYNLDLFCSRPSAPQVESVPTPPETPSLNANGRLTETPPPRPVGKSKGGEGMLQALERYKSAFPHIDAVIIGTRRTDPHGAKLSYRNMTDPGWPQFERVNPIINWSYTQVWDFLRRFNVPYCHLYDQGYTSLGSTFNTFPNPALKICEGEEGIEIYHKGCTCKAITHPDSQPRSLSNIHSMSTARKSILSKPVCPPRFKPAYMLTDGNLERSGRAAIQPRSH